MTYTQTKAKKEIEPNWEWYVLCKEPAYPADSQFNKYPYDKDNSIKPWNVFNNCHVYDWTRESCKKYLRKKLTWDEFKEELRGHFQNQLWSRVEYEFEVKDLFDREDKAYKVDVYEELLPNLEAIAQYVIAEWKKAVKESKA